MSEHYEQLILKSLTNEATEEERQELITWCSQSDENKQLLNDYQKIWKSGGQKQLSHFNSLVELKKLEARLDQEDSKIRTLKPAKNFALKIAASIALVIISSLLLYQTVFKIETIVQKSGAEKIHFTLPDGSTVWLNEKSKVTYASDFNDSRVLELSGEGFFEVTRNPNKPFSINLQKSQVKVLGTSFNIRAYEKEEQNVVSVVSGKVSFSDTKDQTVLLNPGNEGVFNKHNHTLIRNETTNPNLLAWKSKQLIFKKTSLNEVSKILERYFQISIIIKNVDLQKCRFTSSFQDPTLEEVIEAIRIALNVSIIHQNGVYTFEGSGC
jgi:transmembrane sensor